MDGLGILSESVKTVRLQFSFSNPDVVPKMLRRVRSETSEERAFRKGEGTELLAGIQFIEKVENVSLAEVVERIEVAGYQLVDACHQRRLDENGRWYNMVRYTFAHPSHEQIDPKYTNHWLKSPEVREPLRKICEQAMWRVRAYLNQFFHDGKAVPGCHAMSINLEARKPLFDNVGNPIRVWQKDVDGNRVGTEPIPLKPEFALSILENRVLLKGV